MFSSGALSSKLSRRGRAAIARKEIQMFKRLFTTPRGWSMRLMVTVSLAACLVWLALMFFRPPVPVAVTARAANAPQANIEPTNPAALPKLEGAAAREYVEQTSDGQSLMAAVNVARFGLKRQEHAPFDKESGAGYLGMSHDQNLNAWFDEEGMTVRPTVAEKERKRAWQLGLRLKGYGYGEQLQAAPPVIARKVKENRIEYERGDSSSSSDDKAAALRVPSSGRLFMSLENPAEAGTLNFSSLTSLPRSPRVVEWYENRAEGIEQGFTVNERPVRGGDVADDEPLRLVVSLAGDLRAHVAGDGREIELVDKKGKSALSYSKLTAVDADGKQMAARMETNAAVD